MMTPFSPPPGLNSDDTPFSATSQWADGNNVRFVKGKPQTIGGSAILNHNSISATRKLFVYEVGGAVRIAAAGLTLHSVTIDGMGELYNITPASGWATADATRFCFAMFGDALLASISGGKLFESWAGGQATQVANAPPKITCMLVTPSRQVIALGCNEEQSGTFNGRCIRWSDIENHEDWTTSASNNAGEYILPGQADIVGGCILGDDVLIWTETDLWLGHYVGDPSATFAFTRVAGIGLAGLDAFAIYRQTVYWISPYLNVHSYQPGLGVSDVPCPISRDFSENCHQAHRGRIHAFANSRFGEIWFYYPDKRGFPQSECSRYIAYAVNESAAAQRPVWFRGQQTRRAVVDSPLLTTTTAMSSYGTTVAAVADLNVIADDRASPLGSANAPTWHIQSSDFYLDSGHRRMMIRRFVPDFGNFGGGFSLTLYLRDRPNSIPPATKGPYVIDGITTKNDFRVSGKLMSVHFSAIGVPMRMGQPLFDIIPMGER